MAAELCELRERTHKLHRGRTVLKLEQEGFLFYLPARFGALPIVKVWLRVMAAIKTSRSCERKRQESEKTKRRRSESTVSSLSSRGSVMKEHKNNFC